MKQSVGEAIVAALKAHGVDTVFGIPGAHTIEFYKHLGDHGIRHILARHEQGAAYMADGYARASGRPGVCLLVAGPGLTNAASALGTAFADSSPILVLTSVNGLADMDMERGQLHEVSFQADISRPLSGMSLVVLDPSQALPHVERSFYSFSTGRPRPSHISVPLDVLEKDCPGSPRTPVVAYRPGPHPEAISAACALVRSAKRPFIVAGGGARNAAATIAQLAERIGAPVVTTIAGKGVVAAGHPLDLGATLQRAPTRVAIRESDLVIVIGSQLSPVDLELWPHSLSDFAERLGPDVAVAPERLQYLGKMIRIDLDPSVMTRDHRADVAIVGDADLAARSLLEGLGEPTASGDSWALETANEIRDSTIASANERERRHIRVLAALRDALPADGFVSADLCQLGYSANVFFPMKRSGSWFYPAGYGPLGFAMPAAIGAQLSDPNRRGLAIIGDYGVQFTIQDLATAAELGLPLPILIWNNNGLGEIKDWMRWKNAPPVGVEPINPDFSVLARAYRCNHSAPQGWEGLQTALREAHRSDRPTLIELMEAAPWLQ